MHLPVSYTNGTYEVTTNEQGCSTFKGDIFVSEFPDTIDLKVTDFCNAGCAFCHENSTKNGQHANLKSLKDFLYQLPWVGIQLAIGGGNPLAWPHLEEFLVWAQDKFVCNITVNGLHVRKNVERLKRLQENDLIHGIGISAVTTGVEFSNFNLRPEYGLKHVVGHTIVKRWQKFDVDAYTNFVKHEMYKETFDPVLMPSILFLGYKDIGRGAQYREDKNLDRRFNAAKPHFPKLIKALLDAGVNVHFDNLAIEQLDLKRKIKPNVWEQMYLGDEGTRSMFVDAVKQEVAVSSTSLERSSWTNLNLLEWFKQPTTTQSSRL